MTPAWRRYIRFWGARVDADVDDELAFHLDMRVADYIARGMSECEARAAATRRLGNAERARRACLTIGHRRERRMTRVHTIDAFVQDFRYGVRSLSRQKAWTTIALFTMALGIGASTAVFSAVNSLILNPLPYRDANRVVMVWRSDAKSGVMIGPSQQMLDAWRAQAHVFDGLEVFDSEHATITGRGDPVDVSAGRIQPTFPAFTGVPLIAGRTFLPEETIPGGPGVVLLGERLWRERFAGSRDVLGQRLTLNDKPYTIVGVAAADLRLPTIESAPADVWLPLVKDSTFYGGMIVARVRHGVSLDAAATQLESILAHNHLDDASSAQFRVTLVPPGNFIGFRSSLFLLAGAVGVLLLVACANVAHLLLARGATRQRELAIRAALGAGRWRIARQLLTESAVLAAAGCAVGIAVGYAGVRLLSVLRPDSLAPLSLTHLDARALNAAVVLSVIAGTAFGCTSALHAVRHTASEALRASAATAGAPHTDRLRSVLVVSEMALSALLLVGAALLVRSVIKLQHVDRGFDTRGLFVMDMNLPRDRYQSGLQRNAFVERVMDAARHMPGAIEVTRSTATPPNLGGFMLSPIEIEGSDAAANPRLMPMNFVDANYFHALGIPLEGATFSPTSNDAREVIIDRGFATKYWPDGRAVGRRFRFKTPKQRPGDDWMRVIGVAADVPTRGLSGARGEPLLYEPIAPTSAPAKSVVTVRMNAGLNPAPALRAIVRSMDSHLVPPPVMTSEASIARTIETQRFTMVLLAAFASLAVLLSAVGLYGVIAYVVTQRTREIGIRIALGATPRHIARAIVARGVSLSLAGLAIGLVAAVWGTALIKSSLFGITGTDPVSYAAAAVLLTGISVAASVVPMRRATAVDPVIAMRGE